MKKTRFLRDSKGRKLGVIVSIAEFERLREASEDLECLCTYDVAKALDETPIPYEQVLRKIEKSRR